MSFPVSAAISPCARFIATGSEDRAVYVYDIRYPSPLHKLSGHSDVVTTVTYHPLRPMVCRSKFMYVYNVYNIPHYPLSLLLQQWTAKLVSWQKNKSNNC